MNDEEVNVKFLQKAARNIDHISSLVEDLVTISMIESGEVHIEYSSFNIKDLVKEVIDFLDLPAKGRNITLQMKCLAEHELYVNADRQKIKQVLINLLGNSIKYGRENGNTSITIEDLHAQVSIEVSDNGEGIAEEHLHRIFERFYRVDKSRSRSQSGTGLGLSIVKHFIEAHKQKIIVSSVPGIGSIFSFTLDKAR
jgi:two-component system phosphate regulon sensor histidine kinase PhoR